MGPRKRTATTFTFLGPLEITSRGQKWFWPK